MNSKKSALLASALRYACALLVICGITSGVLWHLGSDIFEIVVLMVVFFLFAMVMFSFHVLQSLFVKTDDGRSKASYGEYCKAVIVEVERLRERRKERLENKD